MAKLLLAGDIGGTKTLLGLFAPAPARPQRVAVRAYGTIDFPDLPSMIVRFLADAATDRAQVAAACFGVAGPVIDVEFPPTALPELNTAIEFQVEIEGKPQRVLAEVAQQLGQGRVRAVCLKPTDGLRRGTPVRNTGHGIQVPVGDQAVSATPGAQGGFSQFNTQIYNIVVPNQTTATTFSGYSFKVAQLSTSSAPSSGPTISAGGLSRGRAPRPPSTSTRRSTSSARAATRR